MVNVLPANILLTGRIVRLERLPDYDYPLVKAREYTLPARQIKTTFVTQSMAESLLESPADERWLETSRPSSSAEREGHTTLYVRTDRTGRVREAYRDTNDVYGLQDQAVIRALTYRFRPLIIHGIAQQMEAPITLASKPIRQP